MTERVRLKRPPLDRTAPIRNLGKAFHQNGETPRSKQPDQPIDHVAGPGLEDAVSEGVRLGYSVIEDQIRQAQGLASKLNPGGYGLFGREQAGGGEIKPLLDRLLRTYGDLTNVWLEVLNATLGNTDILNTMLGKEQAEPNGSSPKARADSPRPAEGSTNGISAVSFNIIGKGPIETDIRFFGGGEATSFVVQDLRSREQAAPPLDDITLIQASNEAPARIVVKVPNEQPPGLYQGLILDQLTDAPIGSLGVKIGVS
ncbi:MAG: hypothetical protein ACR2QJ_05730 [Geminicoccaceae bacterium]